MASNSPEASLLYECLVELSYAQECCTCGHGSSGLGKELIQRGLRVLQVRDLSEETLARKRLKEHEESLGKER